MKNKRNDCNEVDANLMRLIVRQYIGKKGNSPWTSKKKNKVTNKKLLKLNMKCIISPLL